MVKQLIEIVVIDLLHSQERPAVVSTKQVDVIEAYEDFVARVEEARFLVVYVLRSMTYNLQLRVVTLVDGITPQLKTVTDLFPAAS